MYLWDTRIEDNEMWKKLMLQTYLPCLYCLQKNQFWKINFIISDILTMVYKLNEFKSCTKYFHNVNKFHGRVAVPIVRYGYGSRLWSELIVSSCNISYSLLRSCSFCWRVNYSFLDKPRALRTFGVFSPQYFFLFFSFHLIILIIVFSFIIGDKVKPTFFVKANEKND